MVSGFNDRLMFSTTRMSTALNHNIDNQDDDNDDEFGNGFLPPPDLTEGGGLSLPPDL